MGRCLICNEEISDETNSGEHLILESIGGRRTVRNLLHRKCNSTAGDTWDADLAKKLQPLSLMFGISRQKGGEAAPLRVVTSAQEHFTLGPSGKLTLARPVFTRNELASGAISYDLQARSMSEARKMLEGLKRKHPQLDVKGALAQAKLGESYAVGDLHHDISIGGPFSGRSIVKSCVAMAFASGIPWKECTHAIRYLREASAEPSYGFYNRREIVKGRTTGVPIHCLAVKADPETGLILAYAEYYGIHRVIALLGESYSGDFVEATYAIDPRDGSQQDLIVDLNFDRQEIAEIYEYKHVAPERTVACAQEVIGPTLQRQREAERQRVINGAVKKAFDTCGAKPGELITPEFASRIARSITESMMPLITHTMRPMHSRPGATNPPNRQARRSKGKPPRRKK